ncbi:ECF-type riboflavin transporter substrate-binding protein [Pediococcus argentinicus]|uniref:UPF0397 protein IV88_GL000805 n=1 Tax=Pediococcus argentinicus TaxID=480391 RepID=A0A0R2NJ28_9LACO|nr:ECF-type riboflavin transporter substrate-binding protein [Pediococcus argentinicus]KRO24603.1 hypothetical protein IV88_GL000805 [Pediococcus argentinicus]NKZ22821.1 ECF-type riboflavin transporter substrate-binding protein [Pediococcus argentinicus]
MKKNNTELLSVRNVVAIGIGTAIFFVLGRFLPIPTGIPNTTINLGYAVLSLIAVIFGPLVGGLVALFGHLFIDFSWGDPWWTWIIADGIFGAILGYSHRLLKIESEPISTKKIIQFNVVQILGNIIAWLIIAPIGDIVIYSQPATKVFLQGVTGTITNALTIGVVGTALLIAYSRTRVHRNSLTKE